jgi:hypothetical protein
MGDLPVPWSTVVLSEGLTEVSRQYASTLRRKSHASFAMSLALRSFLRRTTPSFGAGTAKEGAVSSPGQLAMKGEAASAPC